MLRQSFRKSFIAGALMLIAVSIAAPDLAAEQRKIKAHWSQRNRRADIDSLVRDGVGYVSLKGLADFLGAEYSAKLKNGKCTVIIKETVIGFTRHSPYVIIGDK